MKIKFLVIILVTFSTSGCLHKNLNDLIAYLDKTLPKANGGYDPKKTAENKKNNLAKLTKYYNEKKYTNIYSESYVKSLCKNANDENHKGTIKLCNAYYSGKNMKFHRETMHGEIYRFIVSPERKVVAYISVGHLDCWSKDDPNKIVSC